MISPQKDSYSRYVSINSNNLVGKLTLPGNVKGFVFPLPIPVAIIKCGTLSNVWIDPSSRWILIVQNVFWGFRVAESTVEDVHTLSSRLCAYDSSQSASLCAGMKTGHVSGNSRYGKWINPSGKRLWVKHTSEGSLTNGIVQTKCFISLSPSVAYPGAPLDH